jgi:hypothetical protein
LGGGFFGGSGSGQLDKQVDIAKHEILCNMNEGFKVFK